MTKFLRVAGLGLFFLSILASTLWGAGALYFSHAGRPFASVPAAALACAGLAVLAALFSRRWRWRSAGAFACLFGALLWWWSGIEPSNDRHWKPEVAVAPYATIDGDSVTIHNVRNFEYRSETDFTPRYYDRTFDLRNLTGVDVVASYWMGPHIAHVFLSFDFGPDGRLAISIERRDEMGEGYSTVKGLFRQFELYYVVADERDVIGVRTNFRADPPEDVYLYRVRGPVQNARRVFLEYLNKINSLQTKPEFYNTLVTNCTSNIWLHTRVNPGHVAYSWKLLLSGHVPEYLYDQGRLDQGLAFADLRARSRINDRARAAGLSEDFSARIRAGLPGMGN